MLIPTRPNSVFKKRLPYSLLELPREARGAKLSRTFELNCEKLVEERPQDLEQPVEVIAIVIAQLALAETPYFHLGTRVKMH